jgi:hypothetical protein
MVILINKDLTEQYNENTCYALDRLEISNPSEIASYSPLVMVNFKIRQPNISRFLLKLK